MQAFSVKPTDAWVKADKALTLFMLNTLMENARKYTQQGGEIQVYAREEEDYVEISVQDNGPGIEKEDMENIFLPGFSTKINFETGEVRDLGNVPVAVPMQPIEQFFRKL